LRNNGLFLCFFRSAIDRAIAAWQQSSDSDSGTAAAAADTMWQSDPFLANFTRQFIKAGEHTYGRDHRGWPEDGLLIKGWSNAEFHRCEKRLLYSHCILKTR
jgi:hypothetical protein